MKIFKSIKWRLQIWYGLILVVVLAGFGVTAYQLERDRQCAGWMTNCTGGSALWSSAASSAARVRAQCRLCNRPPPGSISGRWPAEFHKGARRKFHLPPEDARFV